MTSFTYFPAVSDVNVILSEGLFSHVAAQLCLVCFVSFIRKTDQLNLPGDDNSKQTNKKSHGTDWEWVLFFVGDTIMLGLSSIVYESKSIPLNI